MDGRLASDFRAAIRGSRSAPGVTLLVVATLTVALAANIAAFSLIDALLLRPYAYPDLPRLMLVRDNRPAEGAHQRRPISPADFLDLAALQPQLGAVTGFRPFPATVTGAGDAESIQAAEVAAAFFETLDARFDWGRGLGAGDDPRAAVVTERIWRARLGSGPPGLVPMTIALNGEARNVVGIVRDEDAYPSGIDVWVPLQWTAGVRRERRAQSVTPVIRLAHGMSLRRAQAEIDRLAADRARAYPDTNAARGFALIKLRDEQYEFTRPLFLLVQASAAFLLVLACANVLNLMLTRTIDRREEFAVRAALGATRRDLMRAVAVEAPLAASAAGLASLGLASWTLSATRAALPSGIARWIAGWSGIGVNWRFAVFAAVLSVAVGILVGLAHAAFATRDIRLGFPGVTRGASRRLGRLRHLLLVIQAAAAALLLCGAGTMLQGYRAISSAYAPMTPERVLTLDVTLPEWKYVTDVSRVAFFDRLMSDLSGLAAIESAGLVRNVPASNVPNGLAALRREDHDRATPREQLPRVDVNVIGGGAFETLGMPLMRGRTFSDSDRTQRVRVAVVSEAMAQRYWPDRDAIGQRMRLESAATGDEPVTIVGITGDLKQNWYDPAPRAVAYVPYWQMPSRRLTLIARGRRAGADLAPSVRQAIRRVDPAVPTGRAEGFDQVVGDSLSPIRVLGWLLFGCGAAALLLSASGMYGALRTYVVARRREFAIRAALGAGPTTISRIVVGHAGVLCLGGAVAVVPIMAVVDQFAGPATFGLAAFNAATIGLAIGAVLAVALLAAWAPTRAAVRFNVRALLMEE